MSNGPVPGAPIGREAVNGRPQPGQHITGGGSSGGWFPDLAHGDDVQHQRYRAVQGTGLSTPLGCKLTGGTERAMVVDGYRLE